jgi:hypothetical protein
MEFVANELGSREGSSDSPGDKPVSAPDVGDFGPTSSYLAGSFQAGKSIENGVLLRQLSSLPRLQITAVLKDRVSGFSVSKGVGRTRFAFGKE